MPNFKLTFAAFTALSAVLISSSLYISSAYASTDPYGTGNIAPASGTSSTSPSSTSTSSTAAPAAPTVPTNTGTGTSQHAACIGLDQLGSSASAPTSTSPASTPQGSTPTTGSASTPQSSTPTTSPQSCGSGGAGLGSLAKTITTILSYLVGIAAVIMIIVGGLRYVTSGGDSNKVASAKSTIVYALIGLAIAALAYVLANYVLVSATNPTSVLPSTPAAPIKK